MNVLNIGEVIAGDVVCLLWNWYKEKVGKGGTSSANCVGGIGPNGGSGAGTMTPPGGTNTFHRHIHHMHGGMDMTSNSKQGANDFV